MHYKALKLDSLKVDVRARCSGMRKAAGQMKSAERKEKCEDKCVRVLRRRMAALRCTLSRTALLTVHPLRPAATGAGLTRTSTRSRRSNIIR